MRIAAEARLAVTGANEVHKALSAPEHFTIGDYEIASRVVPARLVSGDFIYTLDLRDQTVLLLGDLMGKGLSAAMWIAHIVDLIQRAGERASCLTELMTQLNLEILRSRVRAPLTSAIGISIGKSDGIIHCSSAGHPAALITRANGTTRLCHAGGPLLGVFAEAVYHDERVRLDPGDALIAYSDGLLEAGSESRGEWSLEEVASHLVRNSGGTAATKLSRLIHAAMHRSEAVLSDDLCVLVVERR